VLINVHCAHRPWTCSVHVNRCLAIAIPLKCTLHSVKSFSMRHIIALVGTEPNRHYGRSAFRLNMRSAFSPFVIRGPSPYKHGRPCVDILINKLPTCVRSQTWTRHCSCRLSQSSHDTLHKVCWKSHHNSDYRYHVRTIYVWNLSYIHSVNCWVLNTS